jgi:hypothetical protein
MQNKRWPAHVSIQIILGALSVVLTGIGSYLTDFCYFRDFLLHVQQSDVDFRHLSYRLNPTLFKPGDSLIQNASNLSRLLPQFILQF